MDDLESGKQNSGKGIVETPPAAEISKNESALVVNLPCGHSEPSGKQNRIYIDRRSVKLEVHKVKDVAADITIKFDYNAYVGGRCRIALYLFETKLGTENDGTTQIRENLIDTIDNVKIIKTDSWTKWTRTVKGTSCFRSKDVCYLTIETHSGDENLGNVVQFTQAVIQKQYNGYSVRAVTQDVWFNGDKYLLHDFSTGYVKGLLSKIPSQSCLLCLSNKIDSTTQEVGKMLLVSTTKIGESIHGNASIHEGSYGDKEVTVKKMSKKYKDVAVKEIKILQDSKWQVNFPMFCTTEEDEDEEGKYVYIALERCACSLKDLIYPNQNLTQDLKDINLMSAGSHPSPQLLNIIRGVAEGLDHLHNKLGYVHGGLNPEAILIRIDTASNSITPILSDLGGCETLSAADCSVNYAAELKAQDLLDFGKLIFRCITGEEFRNNTISLDQAKDNPKAKDLISSLTKDNSENRLTAQQVLKHPLLWAPGDCINFLINAYLYRYELVQSLTISGYNDWDITLDNSGLLAKLMKRDKAYTYNGAFDLLEAIRNLMHHPPEEEWPEMKTSSESGERPCGINEYICFKFPELGWQVYEYLKTKIPKSADLYKLFQDRFKNTVV